MSDTVTKAYRIPDDVSELAKQLYQRSGVPNEGEWFTSILQMAKLQELGRIDPSFKQDIEDFEKITNRYFYLFVNLLSRSKDAINEHELKSKEDLLQKEEELKELESTIKKLNLDVQHQQDMLAKLTAENEELNNKMLHFERAYITHEELIKEYKNKIASLENTNTNLLNEASNKDELIKQFNLSQLQQREEFEVSLKKVNALLEEKNKYEGQIQSELERLKKDYDENQKQHTIDLELQARKLEHEKQQEILRIKQEFTDKYTSLVENYANKFSQFPSPFGDT